MSFRNPPEARIVKRNEVIPVRRWISFFLAMGLLCGLVAAGAPERAEAFTDMTGHWSEAEVQAAVAADLVRGYPEGTFRPDEDISRAEFIALMARVQNLTPEPGNGGFGDLHGHWLAEQGVIAASVRAGLVVLSDYGEPPSLEPDRPINRVEAAIFIARATNRLGAAQTLARAPLPYTDAVPAWATGFVAAATSAGVLKGNGDGSFGAGETVTRAQAAAIALRTQQARGAIDVPVWEGNSWEVSTLPVQATQVAGAPDGTLYWITWEGPAVVWRQSPGEEPVLLYEFDAYSSRFLGPMAARDNGLYLAMGSRVYHLKTDGTLSLFAGAEEQGYRNGPAAGARFRVISGMCSDAAGNLFVTEGANEGLIRTIDAQGQVSTIAGQTLRQRVALRYGGPLDDRPVDLSELPDGPAYLADLWPSACTADSAGNVYFVDRDSMVRRLSPDGMVTWYAGGGVGNGDGAVEEAGFGTIQGLTVDNWGNLWLLDGYDRVRRITPDRHAYTVAGGGGKPIAIHYRSTVYAGWHPNGIQKDGPGPDALFSRPRSLALSGGQLYVADGSLRVIRGCTDWYGSDISVVLHPQMDDPALFAIHNGTYGAGELRLPIALYSPAEGVGLQEGGKRTAESHHPLYSLRWTATEGTHDLTPLIHRPDGKWVAGRASHVTVAPEGKSTDRAAILLPRRDSWIQGTVELKAASLWQEAELRMDGNVLLHGSGILSVRWDSTSVPDGFHRISLTVSGAELVDKEVLVANGGLPPKEPEDGFLAYLSDRVYSYRGPVLPRTGEGGGLLLPFFETATAMGYTPRWIAEDRMLAVAKDGRTVTVNVDTGVTTGLPYELVCDRAVILGDEFLVDIGFFVALTPGRNLFSEAHQTLVLGR